jgi:drug/metabolite transporter (DMT)-like permease
MATTRTRAYTPAAALAAAAGVFAWGMGVVFIKLTDSPFLIISFYRHLFAVPMLAILWLLANDRSLPWRTAGLGGIVFAAHQLANFSALRYSTAAVVTILFSLQPILVGAFAGRFVGEHASRRFFVWSVVAVGGCAVVVLTSTGEATTSPLGAALSVANLLLWCAYYLASKKARETLTTISFMFVMTLVSGIIVTVIALVARADFGAPEGSEWIYLVLVALVSGTIGHLLVTWAHPRIHVAASSAIVLGVPIVATAGTAVFVGEPIGVGQVIGAVVALAATGVAMRHLPPPVAAEAAMHSGEVGS